MSESRNLLAGMTTASAGRAQACGAAIAWLRGALPPLRRSTACGNSLPWLLAIALAAALGIGR